MEYIKSQDNGMIRVTLSGKFTFADHTSFKNILADIEREGVNAVQLDFGEVEFIDSAALGLLLLLRDMAEKQHVKVTLSRPQGQVKKMFEISRFSDMFTVN